MRCPKPRATYFTTLQWLCQLFLIVHFRKGAKIRGLQTLVKMVQLKQIYMEVCL